MSTSARAPWYDLFKLVVTIILLLLFLFLLFSNRPSQTRQFQDADLTITPLPSLPSATLKASPTAVPASSTSLPPTATLVPTETSTPNPSPTNLPTLTPTTLPQATETPVPDTLPTPIVEIPADTKTCEAIAHSQLQVGMQAAVVQTVNFRSSPGIFNNWIKVNLPNTQVEIIGGPSCTRYENGGAYLWWQVKLPDGRIGWSAEASAFGKFYFMEPVK